jgi:DNA-binding NarL/FixJ family response regulator
MLRQGVGSSSPSLPVPVSIPARIVLVDDQRYVLQTLRSLLTQEPSWHVYDVETGKLALELIRQIRPRVAVLDHYRV